MRLTYTRKQFVALVSFLQGLTESQPDATVTREVLYDLTVKLYKRLLDVQRPKYTLQLTRVQCLAFAEAYHVTDVACDLLALTIARELHDLIDRTISPIKSTAA